MKVKKELGSYPPDFEPWFLMWDSVLFLPNADARNVPLYGHMGDAGLIPCHQHRSCKALIKVTDKYPPRVCVHCGVDTLKEHNDAKARGELSELWLPCISTS